MKDHSERRTQINKIHAREAEARASIAREKRRVEAQGYAIGYLFSGARSASRLLWTVILLGAVVSAGATFMQVI